MRAFSRWVLIGGLVLAVAGCDGTSGSSSPSESGGSTPSSDTHGYGEAALLLQALNERLETSARCDIYAPHLTTGYAERVPNEEAAACRFGNGTPLFALIVENSERTYERFFGRQRGPNTYLRGRNWLIVAPVGVPRAALSVLEDEFGATG